MMPDSSYSGNGTRDGPGGSGRSPGPDGAMALRPSRDTPSHDGDPILRVRVICRDDSLAHRRRPGVLHAAGTLGELMHLLHHDDTTTPLETAEPPCLSLYMPTHRHHPENQQDPIRFRNLVKSLDESLARSHPTEAIEPLLEPFWVLADDHDFWNTTFDGLAVFGAKGTFRVFRLQRTVAELAVAADSFHTKPLRRILQSADRYQVLGVNRHAVRLFEGNRDTLDELVPADGVPRGMADALSDEPNDPAQVAASSGGVGQGLAATRGHGGKGSKVDSDTEHFFRAVDRAVLEHHSRPTGLPLLLATLPEYRPVFHTVSRNPFLLEEGLDIYPDDLPIDELRQRAWLAVEPRYRARLAALVEQFGTAQANGLGHDDLTQVAAAALAGRVATLLIEADRLVPGRIDTSTGEVVLDDLASPSVDDVLDDLGELVARMGGEVIMVPAPAMATTTGIAAIYRH